MNHADIPGWASEAAAVQSSDKQRGLECNAVPQPKSDHMSNTYILKQNLKTSNILKISAQNLLFNEGMQHKGFF